MTGYSSPDQTAFVPMSIAEAWPPWTFQDTGFRKSGIPVTVRDYPRLDFHDPLRIHETSWTASQVPVPFRRIPWPSPDPLPLSSGAPYGSGASPLPRDFGSPATTFLRSFPSLLP